MRTHARALSLRRGNQRAGRAVTSARSRRPLRARPRRLKTRARGAGLWPRLRALNGQVPYQVRMTPERPEPQARKNLTLEECNYRPVASKPAQAWASATGALSLQKITD
jgi:hypothetical protein